MALFGSKSARKSGKRLVFVGYAKGDREIASLIISELEANNFATWSESKVQPGEDWQAAIKAALDDASAFVVIASPEATKEDSLLRLLTVASNRRKAVFLILVRPTTLPDSWAYYIGGGRFIDATLGTDEDRARMVVAQLKPVLEQVLPAPEPGVTPPGDDGLAADLASKTRDAVQAAPKADGPPRSVFLVHGHDEAFLSQVEAFVRALGVETVVLKKIGGASMSLLQKLLEVGGAARFAIVLLSADDFGASRKQYESADDVGPRSLQFRARQNVILELGFFYGRLGWENVFVLEKAAPKLFPNFERPTDLQGVVFDRFDDTGEWRSFIYERLKAAKFELPAIETALNR